MTDQPNVLPTGGGKPRSSDEANLARLQEEGRMLGLAAANEGTAASLPASRPRARLVQVLALVLVSLWVMVMLVFLWPEGSDELPGSLLGTWTTTDERYAGRSMAITDSTLTLLVGGGTRMTYPIKRVRRGAGNGESRFDIEYADAEGDLEMVVYWDPVANTLRLENPAEVVWRRLAKPTGR